MENCLEVKITIGNTTDIRKFHPLTMRMANLMQDKLEQRLKKYPPDKDGRDNWVTNCSIQYLICHFNHEVIEFLQEFGKMESNAYNEIDITNLQELKYEAADVCNMAGMVIDKINEILSKDKKEIKHEFEIKSNFQCC